jgi:hypothetical protein
MTVVVLILFALALLDQYLTIQLEREGHLLNLLLRARWRRQRVAVRVVGGVLVIIFLFTLGRYT